VEQQQNAFLLYIHPNCDIASRISSMKISTATRAAVAMGVVSLQLGTTAAWVAVPPPIPITSSSRSSPSISTPASNNEEVAEARARTAAAQQAVAQATARTHQLQEEQRAQERQWRYAQQDTRQIRELQLSLAPGVYEALQVQERQQYQRVQELWQAVQQAQDAAADAARKLAQAQQAEARTLRETQLVQDAVTEVGLCLDHDLPIFRQAFQLVLEGRDAEAEALVLESHTRTTKAQGFATAVTANAEKLAQQQREWEEQLKEAQRELQQFVAEQGFVDDEQMVQQALLLTLEGREQQAREMVQRARQASESAQAAADAAQRNLAAAQEIEQRTVQEAWAQLSELAAEAGVDETVVQKAVDLACQGEDGQAEQLIWKALAQAAL